jgi:hypothetical protein
LVFWFVLLLAINTMFIIIVIHKITKATCKIII